MKTILGLSYVAVLPVVTAVILYLLDKKTAFGKLKYATKQIICGIIFGGLAVIGTEFGVDVGGAAANTRDASVLTAGLIFGAPAGIIAGVIGSVERYLCVYWGGGTFTRLACALSTLIAGVFGAILRKFMFNNKKPTVMYALAIGIVSEVMHMLMIFLTNMSDIATAFVFVQKCSIPMILVNGVAVMVAVLVVTLLGKEKLIQRKSRRQIAAVAQKWLLICVVSAFLITCFFVSVLQLQISLSTTGELLRLNIEDVIADISKASNNNLVSLTKQVVREYENHRFLSYIAREYQVAEINIVDENGIIVESTNPRFVGYDMASGEQSAEFLVLLNGESIYVQGYQPISYDDSISRKYAGMALAEGGFVQVGCNAEQLQKDIAREVLTATVNRHIGQSGYLLIADRQGIIVSGLHAGKNIFDTALGEMIACEAQESETFVAEFFGEKFYCMYQQKDGYYGIAVLPSEEAEFTRDISIYTTVFMEIVIFVSLFILIYFLIKKLVVDNIKSVNGSLAQITGGNLNVVVDVRSNEEFASLSDDINATVGTLKQFIAEAAARIDRELELAKVIQESSLPSVFPPFPEKKELDIFASMDAAKEVGGDFYDFYLLDDDHLAFLVADVSGKGITGAMFMMKAKALIKGFAEQGGDVAEILTKANNALCEGNDAEMFVTCFMGILDLANGKMEFANAGHNPPLIRHGDGNFEYFRTKAGFVLGGMEGIKYRKGEMDLTLGDAIFLYTDGVTEATDSEEKLYGEERLLNVLNSGKTQNARDICILAKADVDAFVGEAPQFDDITMFCIKLVEVNEEGEQGAMNEITLAATVDNIAAVTEFVDKQLEELDCSMKVQTQIDIAIDELFGNIARYAYDSEVGEAIVRVNVEKDPLAVVITFIDGGKPYDPLKREDPDVTLSAEEREIGGLGIFLVKKSMDDISYDYKDGKNILTIKKNI